MNGGVSNERPLHLSFMASEKTNELGLADRFKGFHVADARRLTIFPDEQFVSSHLHYIKKKINNIFSKISVVHKVIHIRVRFCV